MYCMFLVSLTIGITLNMSCTIVLPFSTFDSVLWDDNLLQSVPLLSHQDVKVILQNVNGKSMFPGISSLRWRMSKM